MNIATDAAENSRMTNPKSKRFTANASIPQDMILGMIKLTALPASAINISSDTLPE